MAGEQVERARIESQERLEELRMKIAREVDLEKIKADLQSQTLANGWLTNILGLGSEKAGNIAGLVILLFIPLMACAMFFMNDSAAFTRKDAALSFASIITLALGYLFGRTSAHGSSGAS